LIGITPAVLPEKKRKKNHRAENNLLHYTRKESAFEQLEANTGIVYAGT
jgi:hypothetical protein